uniref:Replication initiator protein n=1 Tax=Dulem virus 166 TaxID=3145643 RepID=A0AAU8AXP0_9VIRU
MSGCTNPLHAFKVAPDNGNGKPLYKIVSGEIDHLGTLYDYIEIPCGKCIACRLAYSRQWADRCMLEAQDHDSNYFVTLTYDDEHLPVNEIVDTETGEIVKHATLVKRDLQLFIKRLRKQTGQKIRYYACGEYGSQTYRPHYHAILFGLTLDDLRLYKMSPDGYNYYNSQTLDDIWKNGYSVITNVTWDTCAYTARYILKKKFGSAAEFYVRNSIEPEFTTMSRRPGIGRNYYEKNKNTMFDTDFLYLGGPDGSRSIKPPRYFERLFDAENPDVFKNRRKLSRRVYKSTRSKYLVDGFYNADKFYRVNEMAEDNLKARINVLRRKEF